METLYDILEVSPKASKEVIEKAYKTLAKKYHPDVQSEENKAIAEEKMKKLNEAYSILSDDVKRAEYDEKIEQKKKQEEQKNYINNKEQDTSYQKYKYEQYSAENNNNYKKTNEDWRDEFQRLSPKEQKRLIRKIQKEANEEYRRNYEAYFRSLGYKIKHKWTIKDVVTVLSTFIVLVIVFRILWLIPFVHNWMINFYNDNWAVQIVVNLFIGLYNGIVKFIKNIGKF